RRTTMTGDGESARRSGGNATPSRVRSFLDARALRAVERAVARLVDSREREWSRRRGAAAEEVIEERDGIGDVDPLGVIDVGRVRAGDVAVGEEPEEDRDRIREI